MLQKLLIRFQMINKLNRVTESMSEKTQKNLIVIPGKSAPIDPNSLIDGSKYFTWAEALNTPYRIPENWQVTANIIRLAHFLDTLREFLAEPIHITSWYRDYESNLAAGGVSNSEHMQGHAADWYVEGKTAYQLYDAINTKVQGGLGGYPSWVHTDLGGYARW